MVKIEYSSNAAVVDFFLLVFLQNRMAEINSPLYPSNIGHVHAKKRQERKIQD